MLTFRPAPGAASETTAQVAPQVAAQVTDQVPEEVAKLLAVCEAPQSRQELMNRLGLGDREHFRKAYLVPALESGHLERTIPDKPQSSKQRYRLTDKGRHVLQAAKGP